MSPTVARRIAYRVARRQGLRPAQARELIIRDMHPELAAADALPTYVVWFAAQCAAIRYLQDQSQPLQEVRNGPQG